MSKFEDCSDTSSIITVGKRSTPLILIYSVSIPVITFTVSDQRPGTNRLRSFVRVVRPNDVDDTGFWKRWVGCVGKKEVGLGLQCGKTVKETVLTVSV